VQDRKVVLRRPEFKEWIGRHAMIQLLIMLTVLVSGSAFAEISQFYNNHVGSSTTYGSPNGIHRYYDNRGNTGTRFEGRESGIPQYHFIGPSDMMRDRGTMNTPMGNTPMGMPQPAPQIMIPSQPFGPGLAPTPFGR
jgi:hypothetical protein